MIDWKKYFDAIYCIHYCKNIERLKTSTEEFKRVGILDSGIFRYYYTSRTPIDMKIRDMLKPTHIEFYNHRAEQVTNLTLSFYQLLCEANAMEYKHILTLEDDVEFIKNVDIIQSALDNLPSDWDYIHFDKVLNSQEIKRFFTMKSGPYFYENYTGGYWGTGCVGWSNKAIKIAIKRQTEAMAPLDGIMENTDYKLEDFNEIKRYASYQLLCYQIGVEAAYTNIIW